MNPASVTIEGVTGTVNGRRVEAGGAYEILLGRDWLKLTNSTADFASGTYSLGGGKVCVKQRGRQLEVMPCTAIVPRPRDDGSDGTESTGSEDCEAEEALRGLLAQFGLGSDSEPSDEECTVVPARWASLPRIRDDIGNQWLEEVNIGPIISESGVSHIRELLVSYKDCFALSFADMEKTPAMTFRIQLKEGAVPVHCGAQRRFAPKEL